MRRSIPAPPPPPPQPNVNGLQSQWPTHPLCLQWAEQGVLLLNSVLTVRAGAAASHQKKGWEQFTDAVIRTLNERRRGVVYLLWGNYAKVRVGDQTRIWSGAGVGRVCWPGKGMAGEERERGDARPPEGTSGPAAGGGRPHGGPAHVHVGLTRAREGGACSQAARLTPRRPPNPNTRRPQNKGSIIDRGRNHVLAAVHPSGLSAARGFFGCRHFSQANTWLVKEGLQPIDWQL